MFKNPLGGLIERPVLRGLYLEQPTFSRDFGFLESEMRSHRSVGFINEREREVSVTAWELILK